MGMDKNNSDSLSTIVLRWISLIKKMVINEVVLIWLHNHPSLQKGIIDTNMTIRITKPNSAAFTKLGSKIKPPAITCKDGPIKLITSLPELTILVFFHIFDHIGLSKPKAKDKGFP